MNNTVNRSIAGLRDENGMVISSRVLALFAYITVAAVYIPTILFTEALSYASYLYTLLSFVIPGLGIWLCAKLVGSVRAMLVFIFITGALIFLGIPSIVPVFFMLVALAAYAIHNHLWLTLVPAALGASLVPFFFTSNITVSLLSLAFIPMAIAIFLCFKNSKNRTATVCTSALWLVLPALVILAVKFFVIDGGSVHLLKEYASTTREEFIVVFVQIFELASANLGTELPMSDIESLIRYMITLTFNFLPALIVVISFIISYVAHSLYVSLVSPITEDKGKVIRSITFSMSLTSAILFLVAFIASLAFENEGLLIYEAAAQNIYVILFPGLSLVTFSFITSLAKGPNASCIGALLYIVFFALLIFKTAPTLVISAFIGSAIVIVMAAKRKADEISKKNGGNNGF